jgi:RimJ/RimL family protein N-acetyltransferase
MSNFKKPLRDGHGAVDLVVTSNWRQVPPIEGHHVRLEPLQESHHAALCAVGLDPDLWELIPYRVTTPEEMSAYIERALKDQKAGTALPFAIIHRASRQTVGSTRFMNLQPAHRGVEIGATWIARPWQRTAVNTEAKYLMLRHAFETLDCLRVELKTDALNHRSRDAIRRIGATEEGVFRRHIVTWSGRVRDSVYFSVIAEEWPRVKASLEARLRPLLPIK